jgi:hypothetical protein
LQPPQATSESNRPRLEPPQLGQQNRPMGGPPPGQPGSVGQPGTSDQLGKSDQPGTFAQPGKSDQPGTFAQPGTLDQSDTLNQFRKIDPSGKQPGSERGDGWAAAQAGPSTGSPDPRAKPAHFPSGANPAPSWSTGAPRTQVDGSPSGLPPLPDTDTPPRPDDADKRVRPDNGGPPAA